MICLVDCQKCKCLLMPCLNESLLVIGNVADPNVNYTVYVKNDSSGRTESFLVLPDAYGVLAIDLSLKPGFFHPNADYFLWVTHENADVMETEPITVDVDTYSCFRISFERSFDDGTIYGPDIQTIIPIL